MVGNHEMWTGRRKSTAKGAREGELEGISSVDKLVQLHRMCEVGGNPAREICAHVCGVELQTFLLVEPYRWFTGPIGWVNSAGSCSKVPDRSWRCVLCTGLA